MDTQDRDLFGEWLAAAVAALPLSVTDLQMEQLYRHLNLVLLANEQFNLTRVTDPAEAGVRLVADSLALVAWARGAGRDRPGVRLLDMGSGAGYPAIPLAICCPHWTVTAIDTIGKKVRFLAQTAGELHLGNFLAEQIQAREWHGRVAPFDLVVSRAMGDLSQVVREGARLLTASGLLVSYHAEALTPPEHKAAEKMLGRYKVQQVDTFEYTLPDPKKAVTRRLIVMGRPLSGG